MPAVRWLLLGALAIGILGSGVELVLFNHFEEGWQIAPLVLLGLGLLLIVWHAIGRNASSLRLLRLVMLLFVVAGPVGIFLHYRANREFQVESDPSAPAWTIFVKAIHSKAPPPLAPGAMTQLGLLGLIYAYKHPALGRAE